MAVITVEGLTKRFGDVVAVDDLSFEVDQGTVVGFLGPNGAGKTTTLRMLLGLVAPTAGSARIQGGPYRQLAAALVGAPEILVLDEPANGLDPEGIHWLRGFLRHLADEGRTVLVSSHVLAEVAQTVDHVVIIAHGRLVTQSTLAALSTRTRQVVRVRTPQAQTLRPLLIAQGIQADLAGPDQIVAADTTTETIGRAAAAAGIVIYEMGADRSNLEEVFLELTSPQGGTS